jgi:hypothetical protein
MGNAVLEYRPGRRLVGLLFVERTIRRLTQLYCLLSLTVQTATAGIGPAKTKIRRKLLAVKAALPLKSP